jgi:hypothetical protein
MVTALDGGGLTRDPVDAESVAGEWEILSRKYTESRR